MKIKYIRLSYEAIAEDLTFEKLGLSPEEIKNFQQLRTLIDQKWLELINKHS